MLEFVNLTGAEAGKDEQTRRKVRSQAMRDYRRRQRAENDRKKVTNRQEPSKIRRTASERSSLRRTDSTASASQQSRCVARVQDTQRASSTTSTNSYAHDSPYKSPGWQADNAGDSDAAFYASDSHMHGISRSLSTSNISPTKSLTPSISRKESSSPSEALADLDKMFECCKTYIHWLCPTIDATAAAEVLTARQDISTSPTVLAALCLGSIGHLDAVRHTDSAFNSATYKARVYKDITERMKFASTATSSETVGCLACLLSFEMSTGSKASGLHLHGLKSIINLKGGIHTFPEPMIMMLECLDLCHSLMFDVDPVYTTPDPASLPAGSTGLNHRFEAAHAIMNLLKVEAFDYNRQKSDRDPYRRRLGFVPRLIDNVKEMLTFYEFNGWQGACMDPDLAYRWRQQLDDARLQGLEPDPSSPDAHYLARIVYLRWLLVYNLSVHPLPPEDPSNQAVIDSIWDTVWKVSEEAWSGLAYLRLWILLSGAVNTSDQAKQSFFQAHLIRCTFQMGLSEWRRVKTFILRFLVSRVMHPKLSKSAAASHRSTTPATAFESTTVQSPMPVRHKPAVPSLPDHRSQEKHDISLTVQFEQPDRSASAPVPEAIEIDQSVPSAAQIWNMSATQSLPSTGASSYPSASIADLSLSTSAGSGVIQYGEGLVFPDFSHADFWNVDNRP